MSATPRSTKIMSFSVPPTVEKKFTTVAKKEGRSKSALFRDMLLFYSTYRPQLQEVEKSHFSEIIEDDIRQGIADIRAGKTTKSFHTAEEFTRAIHKEA